MASGFVVLTRGGIVEIIGDSEGLKAVGDHIMKALEHGQAALAGEGPGDMALIVKSRENWREYGDQAIEKAKE